MDEPDKTVLELVPPLAIGSTPVTPVVSGSPVKFVATPAEGVPMFGVTKVGEVFITKVVPVPVCDAMLVALPIDVIGPVRFASVVTVAALPVVL